MRRREFIGFIGWMATNWALPVYAQQGERRKRVGVLIGRPENDAEGRSYKVAFQQAMEQMGWRPGNNVVVDYRWMAGDPKLAEMLAKELVALRPDILVINSTAGVLAARWTAG